MKIIISKRTNICKFFLPDTANILIEENYLQFDNTIVTDMNVNNCYVLENQTPPASNGAMLFYSAEKGYQLYFGYGERTIPEIKDLLKGQLSDIATEVSILIGKIRLIHDPEPEGLARLVPDMRAMYNFAKSEIEALTVENICFYVLRSAKYEQALSMLKTFL